jgi:peptidoglycan-N-acetylglucosamine deacetylase
MINPASFLRFFNRDYLVYDFPTGEKKLYLTFDDGPDAEVTPEVLKILKERNARATFFCLGEKVKQNQALLQAILADGHAIGNHTYSHLDGWKTPAGEYAENVSRCENYFTTALFRPPYGRFNLSQYFLLRRKYKFILWSVMSHDYSRKTTPDQCLSNVLNNARPGSIIVFHDSLKAQENLLYALPVVLDHFIDKGFSFERIIN